MWVVQCLYISVTVVQKMSGHSVLCCGPKSSVVCRRCCFIFLFPEKWRLDVSLLALKVSGGKRYRTSHYICSSICSSLALSRLVLNSTLDLHSIEVNMNPILWGDYTKYLWKYISSVVSAYLGNTSTFAVLFIFFTKRSHRILKYF